LLRGGLESSAIQLVVEGWRFEVIEDSGDEKPELAGMFESADE